MPQFIHKETIMGVTQNASSNRRRRLEDATAVLQAGDLASTPVAGSLRLDCQELGDTLQPLVKEDFDFTEDDLDLKKKQKRVQDSWENCKTGFIKKGEEITNKMKEYLAICDPEERERRANFFDKFLEALMDIWDGICDAIGTLWENVKEAARAVKEVIGAFVAFLVGLLKQTTVEQWVPLML